VREDSGDTHSAVRTLQFDSNGMITKISEKTNDSPESVLGERVYEGSCAHLVSSRSNPELAMEYWTYSYDSSGRCIASALSSSPGVIKQIEVLEYGPHGTRQCMTILTLSSLPSRFRSWTSVTSYEPKALVDAVSAEPSTIAKATTTTYDDSARKVSVRTEVAGAPSGEIAYVYKSDVKGNWTERYCTNRRWVSGEWKSYQNPTV
jgi:hypothetical protein